MTIASRAEPTRLEPPARDLPRGDAAAGAATHERRAHAHLRAAALSLVLFAIALELTGVAASVLTARVVRSGARLPLAEATQGLTLQRAALRTSGRGGPLIPIYGSSELVRPSEYHAVGLFRARPTGFALLPVGDRAMSPLAHALMLAALEPELRGRVVIVSLSPTMFSRGPVADAGEAAAMRGTFPRVAANVALFGRTTSPAVRRALASRLVRFDSILADDPLLRARVRALASGGAAARAASAALAGPGFVRAWLLSRGDDARVLAMLVRRRPPPIPPRPAALHWEAMARAGDGLYLGRTTSNPFGYEDSFWSSFGALVNREAGEMSDDSLAARLDRSPLWADLTVALEVLREADALPLVISMPLPGRWLRSRGVTDRGLALYHERLHHLATSGCSGTEGPCARVVDFAEHDDDIGFLRDPGGHPSPRGWVIYAHAVDDFYRSFGR